MDQYIIDNMPDDDEPIESDLRLVAKFEDGSIVFDLADDGSGYVITAGVTDGIHDDMQAPVVICFDPTLDLERVMSLLLTLRHATITGISPAATAAVEAVFERDTAPE